MSGGVCSDKIKTLLEGISDDLQLSEKIAQKTFAKSLGGVIEGNVLRTVRSNFFLLRRYFSVLEILQHRKDIRHTLVVYWRIWCTYYSKASCLEATT